MVPDRQFPGSSRSFSPEVEAALEAAMREEWTGDEPPETLRAAVRAAARDAKQRLLRAEEMLVAFKAIELRAAARHGPLGRGEDRVRIVRALIDAYYRN